MTNDQKNVTFAVSQDISQDNVGKDKIETLVIHSHTNLEGKMKVMRDRIDLLFPAETYQLITPDQGVIQHEETLTALLHPLCTSENEHVLI